MNMIRQENLDWTSLCLIVCAGHVTAPKKKWENVKETKVASKPFALMQRNFE